MTFNRLRPTAPPSATKPVIVPFAKAAGLKPLVASRDALAATDSQAISQMVMQWQGAPLSAELLPSRHSADYLVAMHELVRRVAQLQAGAEAPTPPVGEIAEAVVLKQSDWRAAPAPTLTPQTAEWKTLAAWLLWRIAQSTHEALHLLEGQPAQVAESGHWQSGILRLVVLLELAPGAKSAPARSKQPQPAGARSASLDLVMAQPAPTLLAAARLVQFESLLGDQPMSVAAYLQQITRQLIAAAPSLREFFEGLPATWLIPHQPWQSGRLRLGLGLAFNPEAALPPVPQPLITFSQATWLEQHVSVAVAQQLTQILLQAPPAAIDTPEIAVKRAQAAIHDLQNSLTLASRTFSQQAVSLDALAFRLLWGINRTGYEVMQLTSGLPVRLLQPQQAWTNGWLRLALYLEVRAPQQQWRFDLARRGDAGRIAPPDLSPSLDPDALVQSDAHLWCAQALQLHRLETQLWQQVEQIAPEIALLRTSTEVTLTMDELRGQLGVVQLKAGFELS